MAQGEDHLTNEVLELLANRPPRRVSAPSLTPPLGSDESSSSKNKLLNDVIKMLQQLSDRANHAHKCCLCIMSCFKIALVKKKRERDRELLIFSQNFEADNNIIFIILFLGIA